MESVGAGPLRVGVDGRVVDDRYHGIGRVTFELVRQLVGHGAQVVLFVSDQQKATRLDLDALTSLPQVEVRRFDFSVTSPLAQLRWPAALRAARLDAMLSVYHLAAPLAGHPRRYAVLHDCIFETDKAFTLGGRTHYLYRTLTWLVARRCRLITAARAAAVDITRFYGATVPPERIVPWGVDASFMGVGGSTAELPITLPERYYLHVGAHRPHKHVAFLPRVLAGLAPDEYLVLVGSDDPRWPDETDAVARELGVADRIIRLPHVDEAGLLGLYAGAQAFLYPSLVEGFGLPLLEAMAAGVPVVASDIPVFAEIADDAALLADPNDAEPWIKAIRTLDDPATRDALVAAGHRKAASATWDRTGDLLMTAIRSTT